MTCQACIQVCPKNPANFNVDNVRVAKLLGGGLHNCTVVRGMVLKNDTIGSIKRVEKAKVKFILIFVLTFKYQMNFIFSFPPFTFFQYRALNMAYKRCMYLFFRLLSLLEVLIHQQQKPRELFLFKMLTR